MGNLFINKNMDDSSIIENSSKNDLFIEDFNRIYDFYNYKEISNLAGLNIAMYFHNKNYSNITYNNKVLGILINGNQKYIGELLNGIPNGRGISIINDNLDLNVYVGLFE